jgi:hypothetical protein
VGAQIEEVEQVLRAPGEPRLRDQVVAAEDAQVLLGGELPDQDVLLERHAEPRAYGPRIP